MATSGFRNNDFFRLVSDGEKIILLKGGGKDRECIEIINPVLATYSVTINRPMIDVSNFGGDRYFVAGLTDLTVDLQLRGGQIFYREKPLVMGVDIFSRLSIADYLDIINEKIKTRE